MNFFILKVYCIQRSVLFEKVGQRVHQYKNLASFREHGDHGTSWSARMGDHLQAAMTMKSKPNYHQEEDEVEEEDYDADEDEEDDAYPLYFI